MSKFIKMLIDRNNELKRMGGITRKSICLSSTTKDSVDELNDRSEKYLSKIKKLIE